MRVRAAVSYEAQSHTRRIIDAANRAAVDTIYGLRVRHADKHDAAQQHGSHQQSRAEPPLARVRTPAVEHLDVLGAGRAAPGVLAVVARAVHFSCCLLLNVVGARRLRVGVQLRLESEQRDGAAFRAKAMLRCFASVRYCSA